MAFTLVLLILSLIPPISIVPAKRVKPFIGVTATLDSIKIAGNFIPVGFVVLILYPFPACNNKWIPTFLLNKALHDPAANTNSSAFNFWFLVIRAVIFRSFNSRSSTFSLGWNTTPFDFKYVFISVINSLGVECESLL